MINDYGIHLKKNKQSNVLDQIYLNNCTDSLHLYLQESGNTNSHFSNENLMVTVMNLFTGGTDTTSTTLRWALLFMVKYPKIQGKELHMYTPYGLKHEIR